MARPHYQVGEKTAREKLVHAFWECLREMPFDKMTIATVVKHAGVNRNTFYYHYQDLDELAREAVGNTALDPLFIRMLLLRFVQGAGSELVEQIPDWEQRVDRVCLLAGKHSSPELRDLLRQAVLSAWSSAIGFSLEEQDLEGHLALEFRLGGCLSVIAYRADTGIEFDLRDVVDFGIPEDAVHFLRHIKRDGE